MRRFNPSKRLGPLNRVLLSTITLAGVSVLCLSSAFLIRRDSAFKRQLELRAESLANAIASQSQFALLVSDTAELERMAGLAVSGSEDVLYVVVEDASGKITAVGRRPGLSPQSIPWGTRTLRTAAIRDLKIGRDRPVDCIEASAPVISQPTAWPLGVESAAPALLGRIRVGMSLEAQRAMFRSTLRYVVTIAALILLVACVIEYFQFRQRQAREKIRKSELRYRELTEMLPQTVFECDSGGKLTMANQTGLQAFGLSREDLERGTDVLDLIVPEERPRAAENLEQLVHHGGRSTYEYTAQCKDGSTFPAVVYASPILSDGKPVGVRGLLIDISEQRRSEEALREWAQLLESSNDAIVKVLGSSIVSWNSGAERIFGYSAGEVLGQSIDTITPPERRHEIPELLDRLERGEAIANFETVRQRRDGRRVDISLALTPVRDSSGRFIGTVDTSRDITEIKVKQRELLKRNALLELLQGAAIAANEAATVEEAIQTCLDRICSHTGWSVGHAFLKPEAGKSALVSTGLWHFEDPRRFEPFRIVSEQLAVDAGVGLPGRVLENGAPCWIADLASDAGITRGKLAGELGLRAALASPVLVGTEVAGVLEFFSASPPEADGLLLQAITSIGVQLGRVVERTRASGALKENEARYRAITENATHGILSMDEPGRILYANRMAEALFGYTNEELLNLEAAELVPARLRDLHLRRLRDMTASAEEESVSLPLFESTGLHRSGREIPIEISSSGYLTKNNRRVCTALVHDVSQRKTLEAQLRHAQKLESIGQLAAGLAHEINTPIQYVGDNLRFLREEFEGLTKAFEAYSGLLTGVRAGAVTPDLVHAVENVAQETDIGYLRQEIPKALQQSQEGLGRVAQILIAMKEFSHPGPAGRTTVDLNHAIESTILVCRNEWKFVAEMVTDFDPSLPLVPCLPGEINQVVLNLLINAAHAIGDVVKDGGGLGTITVSTRWDGAWAEVRVRDTGTGIPEAIRDRIFDPFFTTKDVGKGTGQGLAIAHAVVVNKHGGSISLETQVGRGTVFVVRLPLGGKQEERPAEEAASSPAGARECAAGGSSPP